MVYISIYQRVAVRVADSLKWIILYTGVFVATRWSGGCDGGDYIVGSARRVQEK
jgi:hypothetical protein